MFKRFRRWWQRNLAALHWEQENFHHGMALLVVWRRGLRTYEVWDFGPNTGSDDVDRLLGTVPRKHQYSALADVARRIYRGNSWAQAKALV